MGKGTIRIPELDSLRGIAALCVMYYHYTHFFRFKLNYSFNEAFDFKYGHHGVELFFIISGFVIFMSLERVSSVKEFIYKRFIRLFPTYWACLSLTLLVVSLTANNDFRFSNFEKISNYIWRDDYSDIGKLRTLVYRIKSKLYVNLIENIFELGYKLKTK